MEWLVYSIIGNPMRRFKYYTRNGKKSLRDYRRDIDGGMSVMDLQRMANKQLSEMVNNMTPNVYPTYECNGE